jgi:hypothetical protein
LAAAIKPWRPRPRPVVGCEKCTGHGAKHIVKHVFFGKTYLQNKKMGIISIAQNVLSISC